VIRNSSALKFAYVRKTLVLMNSFPCIGAPFGTILISSESSKRTMVKITTSIAKYRIGGTAGEAPRIVGRFYLAIYTSKKYELTDCKIYLKKER